MQLLSVVNSERNRAGFRKLQKRPLKKGPFLLVAPQLNGGFDRVGSFRHNDRVVRAFQSLELPCFNPSDGLRSFTTLLLTAFVSTLPISGGCIAMPPATSDRRVDFLP
jgi:hypothetical protein